VYTRVLVHPGTLHCNFCYFCNKNCVRSVHIGKFWDACTHAGSRHFRIPTGITALGAPPHKLGSPSSMPDPMRMKLPTVVHHIEEKCSSRAEAFLSRVSSRFSAVSEPFLGQNGGKLGFWDAERPFLALHDLKPVLATCKPTENDFKAPCRGSSAIVVVVRR
jgi:hypothetical protein